jgi:sugar transferase (PEP-CTERM/EpsH1 system associated)
VDYEGKDRDKVKPIRITHVVRTLATGGTETVVRKLVSSLDPERFQQRVITLISSSGVQPEGTICLNYAPGEAAFLVPRLARVFRRERPDIVHSRNWATIEAVIAAKLAGVRAIVHSEHGRDQNTLGPQPWRRRFFRRISYASADRVFCVSEELRDYYARQLGMRRSAFDVISNGVDVDQFHPDAHMRSESRARLGAADCTIVIGTIGRLDPVKDQRTLVRAAGRALAGGIDLLLVIVGDGPERDNLKQELSRWPGLPQRAVFAGEVKNIANWLNAFDIFVLPSFSEGMSNTLLEAMAVGVASIATNVGSNAEVVEDGQSGLLVQPGDPESMCDKLMRLASQEAWRLQLGRNARERAAAQFSIGRMFRRYEDLYSGLMERRSLLRINKDRVARDRYAQNLRNL